jgi:C4-dicarboxylate-specific signal transduction histidine kinase
MYEQPVVDANNELRFWQWTERGIFDEDGRLLEVQAVGRDVTALKQAETRIRQHQAQLAQVARAWTLGETAAGLAHELNQPLAAVINFARGCIHRLGSGYKSNDELIDAMSQVVVQAERAAEIVRGLRRFISNSGALRVWIPLNELVEESMPYVETEARRHGVGIRTNLAAHPPHVQIDRIQLEQVILNLVRNGAEAMRENGGELTIETRSMSDGQVEVAVRDSGVGIAAESVARIFEPFFTTKPNGLGIGLTLSRSIVEAHGGRLWATANPEGGTTFYFTLPGSNGRGRNHA